MKPTKVCMELPVWYFVVPLHGFIFLRNVKVENRFTDKLQPFLNMLKSEIREEKERDAAISLLDFTSAICIFQSQAVTFLRHWC